MENEVLSFIASFIAMAFVVAAYLVKNKTLYLACQALCIVFLIVSYFFAVNFFGMIGLATGLARSLTFFLYEKQDKTAPMAWSFLFSFLTIASYLIVNLGILHDAKPVDILCVTALIMYAFIFRIRSLKIVRFTMLVPTVLSILYNVLIHAAIFATLTYVFELTVNLVSIARFHVLPLIHKQGNNAENFHKENTNEND